MDLDGGVTTEATTAWATDWQLAQANAPLSLATAMTTAAFTLAWEKVRYLGVPASGGPLAAAPLYRTVPAGTLMAEYHVESSELLDDRRDAQYMGGNPSVWIPGCPIRLALGQDESRGRRRRDQMPLPVVRGGPRVRPQWRAQRPKK